MSVKRKKCPVVVGGAAFVIWGTLSIAPANAAGEQFDAEKVTTQMNNQQQTSYLAGVVEGLATARYFKDGKKKDGMECIYDWFYEQDNSLRSIIEAFEKYPKYPPGVLVDVLVKQKCGE